MTNKENLLNLGTQFQYGNIIYNINKKTECDSPMIRRKQNINGFIEFKKNKKVRISVGDIEGNYKINNSFQKDNFLVYLLNDFFKTVTVYLLFIANEDVNNSTIYYVRAPRNQGDIDFERAFQRELNILFSTY